MGPGPEPPSDVRLSCITLKNRTQHVIYESFIADAIFEAGPYLWPDRLYVLLIPLGFFCKET